MTDQNQSNTIRQVELIFEDETTTGPRFAQRAASSRPDQDGSRGWAGAHGSPSPRPSSTARTLGAMGGRHLAGGAIPTRLTVGTLAVVGVSGIVAANMGADGIAGVTAITALTTSSVAATAAAIVSVLFGGLGATAIVLGSWFGLRRRGLRIEASALFVTMWCAWMVSGLVGTVAIGATPFIIGAIAFPTALTVAATSMLGGRGRGVIGTRAAAVLTLGLIGTAAVAALLIVVGSATVVGALGSALAGTGGALLGVKAWNRWWAPMVEQRERVTEYMNQMFAAQRAAAY